MKKKKVIPYGRQSISEDDILAVGKSLGSEWLTTGPKVAQFEKTFAKVVGSKYAVAVSSGTAALHAASFAAGIVAGDEVIVPAMTFAATANCVVYQGGKPVFADVENDTLLIDYKKLPKLINSRTKAIIAVDYAGHPCNYDKLLKIADKYGLILISDASHALGATYKKRKVGTLSDLTTFSFHPVKHITTGEGGMIATNNERLVQKMRIFRNHGITTDQKERAKLGTWYYEMKELGYNYRISDFQCALGLSQLKKLPNWLKRRREIARIYTAAFSKFETIKTLTVSPYVFHAYHLYVIKLTSNSKSLRDEVFHKFRKAGIGVNVHYIPVHLHPFYQKNFHTRRGLCPITEAAYNQILSLPMYPAMTDDEVNYVISTTQKILK